MTTSLILAEMAGCSFNIPDGAVLCIVLIILLIALGMIRKFVALPTLKDTQENREKILEELHRNQEALNNLTQKVAEIEQKLTAADKKE